VADTVTILNKNTVAGGDAMDESLVTNPQAPGGTAIVTSSKSLSSSSMSSKSITGKPSIKRRS
jgi:hypothetical protein